MKRNHPSKTNPIFSPMLTVKELSYRLQVSYETALFIAKCEIGCVRVGRQYRIPEERLQRYIQALTRQAN